jgi:hypothetical protein
MQRGWSMKKTSVVQFWLKTIPKRTKNSLIFPRITLVVKNTKKRRRSKEVEILLFGIVMAIQTPINFVS